MLFSLSKKTILITGASSGIGRKCAVLCSQMGARVMAFGRDEARLDDTLAQMDHPEIHYSASVDMVDGQKLEAAIKVAVARTGKIHGMINCAGISTTLPLRMSSPAKMDEFYKTNVSAAVNLARLVAKPAHISQDGGSLIFITSVMATVGESGKSIYAMTKGALLAASKSLAIELAQKNIRVNCVSPGVVETPMSASSPYSKSPETLDRIRSLHPLGLGKPEDVAAACVFLLSDASRWVTGINLMVDGGYTAR